ncbi:uncharacterized protein LOC120635973 [Pararge aegeria]|uniref:uncharacterized protein LOC120635973 n=1 Tax=Pararge aegeria TaxID=116150 RepID=UPI0019D09458|nr:uncharacterized protein LOC120635973 [Pararge aegeria]
MEARQEKYLPQAGSGAENSAGESRPLTVLADRGCPSYSGGGDVLPKCDKPFARSGLLQRTPPKTSKHARTLTESEQKETEDGISTGDEGLQYKRPPYVSPLTFFSPMASTPRIRGEWKRKKSPTSKETDTSSGGEKEQLEWDDDLGTETDWKEVKSKGKRVRQKEKKLPYATQMKEKNKENPISNKKNNNENAQVPNRSDKQNKESENPGGRKLRGKKPMAKPEALLVEVKNRDYASVLKEVKLGLSREEVVFTKVRKTRKGDILLELEDAKKGGASQIREKIGEICPNLTFRALKESADVIIRGLDVTVEKQEVEEALRQKVKEFRIKSFWENSYEVKTAIIELPTEEAKKLAEEKKIKIGWMRVSVALVVHKKRCFRCLEYGHISIGCPGYDRSRICYNCGTEGHKAKDCKYERTCAICKDKELSSLERTCAWNTKREAKKRGVEAGSRALGSDIKVLQINLDRTRVAHDLLAVTAKEHKIDLAIIAEPNRKILEARDWVTDCRGDVSLVIFNNSIQTKVVARGNGFIAMKVFELTVYSCYFSPNNRYEEFEKDVSELFESIESQRGEIVVAGDFNAASNVWSTKTENARGRLIMELLASADMNIVNRGFSPTFQRGSKNSTPDITFVSPGLTHKISEWQVLDEDSLSGHRYIKFHILQKELKPTTPRPIGWRLDKLDQPVFECVLKEQYINTPDELVAATRKACDKAMPKKGLRKKAPVYWWNEKIREIREICTKCRRKYTRQRRKKGKNNFGIVEMDQTENKLREEYKSA